MKFEFTTEELAFRDEVRAFIDANLPQAVRRKLAEHRSLSRDEIRDWQRTLNLRNWATPSWPREWGGPGFTPVQRYIFFDELHQAPAPEPVSFNVSMIGPVIATFGTAQQKAELLPRIRNLDDWWCQGFSEPGAGSDLASLSTSARREGDHYVVNGSKIWQGMAHYADWMFTLVRTDPTAVKQAGITMLLIDLKQPGVEVRPVITMDGRHEVNAIFLDNVRVPVERRVGEENAGWDITKFLLGNERTGIARIGMSRHILQRARTLAARRKTALGGCLGDDPVFRQAAAAVEIELQALEITQMRVIAEAGAHAGKSDPRSSILKIRGTQLRQQASELLLAAGGPLALASAGEFEVFAAGEAPAGADWSTTVAPVYLSLRAASIYGGSTEIQKNILAKTVLGL
jgi:alkylation response protein AidB-like acyl-CoA dehydrogenase